MSYHRPHLPFTLIINIGYDTKYPSHKTTQSFDAWALLRSVLIKRYLCEICAAKSLSPLADHTLSEAGAAAVRNASETLKEFSANSLLSGLSQICDHIRPVLNFLKTRKTHFGARRI